MMNRRTVIVLAPVCYPVSDMRTPIPSQSLKAKMNVARR
jgi:hypothetical protein